jgi:predicted acyltransferase (DUF342 family)
MNIKNTTKSVSKRMLAISISLMLIFLIVIPSPNSVVSGTATVSMELKEGWNLKGMPESMTASDLALKSNYITSIVHRTPEGYYVSYIPSIGATDFTLEVNEGVYIYSEVDTIITFTISAVSGYSGGDLVVTGDLDVTGDSIFAENLTVEGSMSILGNIEIANLNVTEDLTVDGDLNVKEDLEVGNDLIVNGNLRVDKDLTVSGLTTTEDLTVNGNLRVKEDTNLDGNLSVAKDMIVDGDSTVKGDMEVLGNLTAGDFTVDNLAITEDLIINGNLTVIRDLTVGDDIEVTDDMSIGDDLTVSGDTVIEGNLNVMGDATIAGNLVAGNFTVGNLTITEDLAINGDLTVDNDVLVSGNIAITGDATISGKLTAGDFTVSSLTVSDDLAINGNLSVAQDMTVDGDSTVLGDMTVLGKLTAGDFTVDSLTIAEDLTINGNLSVLRKLTVGEDITVTGAMNVGDDLTVSGNTLIEGNLNVLGDAMIAGTLTAGNFTVGNLTIAEDLSINGNLFITGDATIGGSLTVVDDITIDGSYTVTEDLTVGGDLFVSGNLTGLALGDMADFVIGRDATGEIYARNGITGNIDFTSNNASEVIQSAIDALDASPRDAGTIYLQRSQYLQWYSIPLRFWVVVDYKIDYTIDIPPGISIISDGAMMDISDLDGTAFRLNPDGDDYGSGHFIWKISNLGFVGDQSNRNTNAIHARNWQYALIIDNIHCEEVTNPIKIEGTAYRTVVQNCLAIVGAGNDGEIGVHIFKGRGPYSPNGATVINSDFSTFKTGIKIDDGYGVRVTNNYMEGNDIAVDSSGGHVSVVGNYFQPGTGGIGVYVYGGTAITGNTFLQGGSAANSYGVYAARSEGQVLISGNLVATDSADNAFFYSDVPTRATIVGNTVALKVGVTSKFIDAELTGSTVTGNHVSRGDPAIRQRMSPAWQENIFSDNTFFSSVTAIITGGRDHVLDNAFSACQTDIQLLGGDNVVRGNNLRGSVARIDTSGMGGGNIIEGNFGYVTENYGTTSAGTSIDVTHGLDGTPDHVIVTPLGQTGYYYVTNKGPTTFTIISEMNIAFDWYAKFKP